MIHLSVLHSVYLCDSPFILMVRYGSEFKTTLKNILFKYQLVYMWQIVVFGEYFTICFVIFGIYKKSVCVYFNTRVCPCCVCVREHGSQSGWVCICQ